METTACQRMEQELKLRRYSPKTIGVYVRAVRNFGRHFDAPPDRLDPEDARAYLLHPSAAKDRPLGARTVQRVFKEARKKAGITKPVTPHTLRHSFATHLLEGGAPVPYIQELLGHRSVKTTMLYARVRADTATAVRSPLDALMPI